MTMNTNRMKRNSRGFSMIEVMISVVVLGFGLMALAALQTSLIRSSAETKAQTVALQLAKDKLEDLRSFDTLTGYQAVTTGTDTVNDSNGNLGGVNYSRSWAVTRFGYQPSAGVFAAIATLTGPTPAADASGVAFASNNEYKRVAITVSWTDANGSTQSIGLEDAIGAVSPGDGSKVVLNNTSTSEPRYPRVLINNPSLTDGVIPIAVGDGDGVQTAATNPKPEIIGNQNNQHVVETRFDVLTYAALTNDSSKSTVQSRVETVVIGCRCNAGNAVATGTAYRPSYWNGFRYSVPRVASYAPPAGPATISGNDPPQSALCTACCRDHHDPAAVEGAKFDPRRTTHAHYKIVGGELVEAGANDNYLESCRLIRVDGIFRVAADFNNDYFNLLEARNDGTTGAFAPTTNAIANYQNFVLDYLDSRIVNQGVEADYNTPLTAASVTALEAARNINAPASIAIQRSNDSKWLHSRGLFIDYLEPEARSKIATSKCSGTAAQKRACVLKYTPFTSINLSELTRWSPTTGSEIVVTNADFVTSGTQVEPVRGKVQSVNATNNTNQTAYASIFNSNSGIALLASEIDPDEVDLQDTQVFSILGGDPTPGSGSYTINVNNYPFGLAASTYPNFSATPNATCNYNPAKAGPNPFTCTSSSIGVGVTLTVRSYNTSDATQTSTAPIECSGPNGTVTYTPKNNEAYPVTYCKNYQVSSVSLNGVPLLLGIGSPSPSDGVLNESTSITFPLVPNGSVINIGMTQQGQQSGTKTSNTCTYTVGTCSGTKCDPNIYTVTSTPCQ